MADASTFVHDHALAEEARELHGLARNLVEHAPQLSSQIARLGSAFEKSLRHSPHPVRSEHAAETFARRLRRVWLEACGAEAGNVYRSPTATEAKRLARHHDAFGYERDLQPESLEARCEAFFPAPPAGWRQDHLLFSSGQAAMTSALLGLGRRAAAQPMRLVHRGAYFETRSLIKLMPFLQPATLSQTPDIILAEPVSCDGRFHTVDMEDLLSAAPMAFIFDTTLMGREDGIDRYLAAMDASNTSIVIRIASCLKLFEAGLELANAGVLSVYTRASTGGLASELRRIRTLTGSGIHLVDAIALEAPWFLQPAQTDAFTRAIFDHNAALAAAVAKANTRFAAVSHPSFAASAAPYCVFQLPDASPEDYDALEREIAAEAERRNLLISHGGSFGFRGHRYETVKPETGDPPFLRIALGRRAGWSRRGITEMMADIAAR